MGKYKKIVGLFLLWFHFSSIWGQQLPASAVRSDMSYLKKRLEQKHLGLYEYQSKAKYDSLFKYLYTHVPDSMDLRQTYVYLAPLITAIHDTHTSFRFPSKALPKKIRTIPLSIRTFQDNYYIALNGSQDSTFQRGDLLLSIDGEPMAEIIKKIQTMYGTDNDNKTTKNYYASRHFSNFYFKYYGEKDSVTIAFSRKDTIRQQTIATLTAKETTEFLKKRYKDIFRKNFDYKIIDTSHHVAHLTISSFSLSRYPIDVLQFKFKHELKKSFKQVEKDSIQHLIVDFRGNGGGFIPNVNRFLSYILPSSFLITDTVFVKKAALRKMAPLYTIIPPIIAAFLYKPYNDSLYYRKAKNPKPFSVAKKYHFNNDLYFLMDGGSYSATVFTLSIAHDHQVGTFIGEQPGGTTWGSFAITWDDFKLPNSKIRIHLPLFKMYHYLPNHRSKTLFLQPDFDVGYNFDDFMKMQDSVLEFTKRLIIEN